MDATAPVLGHALDLSTTSPTPFRRLVAVELRKSWDTRAGRWLLVVIAVLVLLAEGIVLGVTVANDEPVNYGDFVAAAAFTSSILLPVLGIMLVTSEWTQRTAMVTFALEPRRPRVVLAKAIVGELLTLVTVAVALVVGLVCVLLCAAIQGVGPDWTFGWAGFFGFLITQTLAMLGGFALATLFLNTAVSIVVFFVYRWVLPGLIALGAALIGWFESLAPWIDFQSAQGPLYDMSLDGGEWGHLLVSGFIWLVLPVAVGAWRVLRAEVK